LLNVLFNRAMNQFEAAGEGDLHQLRVVLTVDNVNNVDGFGCAALHYVCAAENEYLDCTKHCLEMGANVNACSNGGSTPLHYASSEGHANVARVLLDAGAIDTPNSDGWTPLYYAIDNKRVDVARLLIDRRKSIKCQTGQVVINNS
jgi:ankyrin repeat protein